jgi:hypothetical protein
VVFETLEDRMKAKWPWMFPHPSKDSKINSLVDVGAVVFGAWAARDFKRNGRR